MSIQERSGISRATYDRYPAADRVRTPLGRVVAIAALVVASAVVVAGFAVGGTTGIAMAVAGLLAWVPAMGAVNVVAGGVTAMRGSELDERERDRRDRAFALSHRGLGVLLLVAVIVASAVLPADLDRDHVVAGLFAVFFVQLVAPAVLLATTSRLTEPD
ncbi:unannotated protein [freshwater metagenome]|uniref:Unannotated protein n=1 Tax=freshwater metagenome TaxID=449393 RepID=A0A6J7H141_9ZZZZ|nr:hypothetical protein [Actinomycetota bacterium]